MADGARKFGTFLRNLGAGMNPQVAAQVRQDQMLGARMQEAQLAREQALADADTAIRRKIVLYTAQNINNVPESERETVKQNVWNAVQKDPALQEFITRDEQGNINIGIAPEAAKKDLKPNRFKGVWKGQPVIAWSEGTDTIMQHPTTGEKIVNPVGLTERVTGTTALDPTSLKNTDKVKIELDDAEIGLRQNVKNIQPIFSIINDPNYVGGTSGDVIAAIGSASNQFKQVLGIDKPTGEEDFQKGVSGRMKKAAELNRLEESAVQELAFLHAKSLNPDGKISDADVRAAINILGEGASKSTRTKVLKRMEGRLISNFNEFARIKKRRLGESFKPISLQDIIGGQGPTVIDERNKSIANDIINQELNL